MKFATASEHRDFFQKQGAIEFEGLISSEQLKQLNKEINSTLSAHLKIAPSDLKKQTSQTLFMNGRDLWRDQPNLKKIVWQKIFSEIAAELIEAKPLRLGFDQYFPSPSRFGLSDNESRSYDDLLNKKLPLIDISSLQGVLCGLMLCTFAPVAEAEAIPGDIFSTTAGNGVFFAPETPLAFDRMRNLMGNNYLMLVYVQQTTVYVPGQEDPQTHALKKLGYTYGDKLNDKLNPIIYR